MKIDTTDFGVFAVEIPHKHANDWLTDKDAELTTINSAIDEATSHAADYGSGFVLIEIKKKQP